jgi:hypothetical protein
VPEEVHLRHGGMSAAVTIVGATLRSFASATGDRRIDILD